MSHPNIQGMEFKLEIAAWIDMFKPGILPRTLIGVFLMLFQQFQAYLLLANTFRATWFGLRNATHNEWGLNVCQMIATSSAFFFHDRIGRKPPLLLGSVVNTISHVIVAGMIGKYAGKWEQNPGPACVGVSFILIFMFSFGLGWSPVPWAMPAEVQSSSRRAKGVAIATCCNWFFNFIIGLITPPMIQNIKYGTFIFFAAFSFLSAVWPWFFCPETKGKTLEEMDAIFHTHAAHEEVQAKAEILRAIVSLPAPALNGSHEDIDYKGGEYKGRDIHVERV